MPNDENDWRRQVYEMLIATLSKVSDLEQKVSPAIGHVTAGVAVKKYLTTSEAALEMKVDPETVEKYCREGRLLGFKAKGRGISGEWRISVEEIERWRREGLRRPQPKFPGNPADE